MWQRPEDKKLPNTNIFYIRRVWKILCVFSLWILLWWKTKNFQMPFSYKFSARVVQGNGWTVQKRAQILVFGSFLSSTSTTGKNAANALPQLQSEHFEVKANATAN